MSGPAAAGRRRLRLEPASLPALLDAADQQAENPQEADGTHNAEHTEDRQGSQGQNGDGGEVDDELAQILFHPETEAGCLLAGIRNLSTVTEQADSRIYVGRWDITLSLPAENGMKMLAVPDRAIQPGPGDNAMMCRIIDRIDNPLTVLLVLKPAGTSEEAQPLYWEIPRESCQYLPGDTVQIHLPADELLQLKG